ncbi:MAG: hypothetical protein J6V74_07260 [Bacteroidales bacterium]|nr:hypothetical protein [Bacteroidales bacterium]
MEQIWTDFFFSRERKIFSSRFLKFFLPIKNFFCPYMPPHSTDTSSEKRENQQLFFFCPCFMPTKPLRLPSQSIIPWCNMATIKIKELKRLKKLK